MAFTVEDGTGVSGANAYISVANADTYHDDRGNSAWAALSDAKKQAAILKATSYIEGRYRRAWPGDLYSESQGLSWPRENAKDVDGRSLSGVPNAVAEATAMLALEASSAALAPVIDSDARVKREKLGELETEFAVSENSSATKRYPELDLMLAGIVRAARGMISLVRG